MNRHFIRWIALLVYAVMLLLSMAVAFKAGAAFFYYKITLQPESFQPDAGFSYRYRVNLPPIIFPPAKVLVFENDQQLSLKSDNEVIRDGNGAYSTAPSGSGGFYVYLAPKGNTDPTTNGLSYRLYLANNFLTRPVGILLFSTLLFGAIQFGVFAFRPASRQKIHGLTGFLQVMDDFFINLKAAASASNTRAYRSWRYLLVDGARLFTFTALAAYGLVFMEWLFQVTKPSFMDGMSLGQKCEIFLLSGLALTMAGILLDTILIMIAFLFRQLRLSWLSIWIINAVPAVLITALMILWFDHFTYTVIHYGIVTASSLVRTGYGIIILLTFFMLYRWLVSSWAKSEDLFKASFAYKILSYFIMGLLAVSVVLAFTQLDTQRLKAKYASTPPPKFQNLPNIIVIGSDGVSAQHMSLYGYARDTTPHINRLAQGSLVAENAFTNSGTTLGSIGSILTGKSPTRTRLIYPPDILQGADAYEHLPKILKDLGYTTVQLGVPYYVDAYTTNIQDGFDTVNQRSIQEDLLLQALNGLGYNLPAHFIQALEGNFIDRLLHAFYLENVANPFSIVTQAADAEADVNKIHDLLELFENPRAPVFVHAHLLGTHGSKFRPLVRTFSAGEEQSQDWMPDFYDDAILTFDQYIGQMVETLKATGEYDNTIIVIYSDHAEQWAFNERIPLLIHFPGDQYKGEVQYNVQNLDIAPTLLDYIGLPIPSWMEGHSFLQPDTGQPSLVFSVSTNAAENIITPSSLPSQNHSQVKTQNYKFSVIQVIDCQHWYRLDLQSYTWTSGTVFQYVSPCPERSLLDMAQIKQALVQHLSSQGYDIKSIP
jgi:hypothetical protein